ncbi:hypothetical protein DITRI_Ditri03aG0029600 [Diplodiscus trichospermus]
MSPWCFHQVPGHQWLVPVISPSEGLIYKPYPGPGFLGSVCGGCGPFGQTSVTSAYEVPSSTQQGIVVLLGAHTFGHSYFPPYGMPVINPTVSGSAVEQRNRFVGPGFHTNNGKLSGDAANFNMQHQKSCNLPSEKKDAVSPIMKFQASTDTELQGIQQAVQVIECRELGQVVLLKEKMHSHFSLQLQLFQKECLSLVILIRGQE